MKNKKRIKIDIFMVEPDRVREMSERFADKNFKFRIFLKKNANPTELDRQFHTLHNEIFHKYNYDCCKCANCCKLYDIRFNGNDIKEIAGCFGQSEDDFIENYLVPDKEEPDYYITKDKPCCFLETDGKCRIYKHRPAVCREFPHTNKPGRLYSMLGLLDFAEDCPVIFEIIERLKKIYNFY